MEAFEMMPEGTYCQLIDDTIIMSPAPTTPHARILSKIFTRFYKAVEQIQAGEVFCAPVDVFLNRKNAYQPDILFVAENRREIIEKKGINGAPDVVIEILSTDRKYDLKKKKLVYEQSGVQEYWVVDPETKWCEGFVLVNGIYKSSGEGNGLLTIRMFGLSISF